MSDFLEMLDEMEPQEADWWRIDSDDKAEWALNKIREEEREAERLKDVCRAQIEKYQRRYEDIAERTAHKTDRLRSMLREYFESGIELKETKAGNASYALPSGKLVRRRQAPSYVRDDALLLEWAKTSAPEWVQTVEKPMWGEIKKHTVMGEDGTVYMKESGEALPGVHAEAQEDKFIVEVE